MLVRKIFLKREKYGAGKSKGREERGHATARAGKSKDWKRKARKE